MLLNPCITCLYALGWDHKLALKCFETRGFIWNNLLSLIFRLNAVLNVEIPCRQYEPVHASCESLFECGWCRCVGVLLFFFFPNFDFNVFFCAWFKDIMQCLWEHPIWRSAIETQSLQNSLWNWKTAYLWKTLAKRGTLNEKRNLKSGR